MTTNRYLTGVDFQPTDLIGTGNVVPIGDLDALYPPEQWAGYTVVTTDGFRYSIGNSWEIPQDNATIGRPSARTPTTADEASQLRLSAYTSPQGITQSGAVFEISTNGTDFTGATVINETGFVSSYQLSFPDSGFNPGDTILWRGAYTGDGDQSEFSAPFSQTFPALITTPSPVTASNAITGVVLVSDFESPTVFGYQYVETQTEFYAETDDPGIDTPVATTTHTDGASTTVPASLTAGTRYLWRTRYGGRENLGAPTVYSEWSDARTITIGAASIVLVYDLDLATSRTIYIPLGGGTVERPLDVEIDWGDGSTETFTTAGVQSHVYAPGGDTRRTVIITGDLDWYGTSSTIDQNGLVRVESIGFSMGLTNLRGAFRDTTADLEFITPDLPSEITSLQELLRNSDYSGDHLDPWDVSNVITMAGIFQDSAFNGLITWTTTSLRDLSDAFRNSQFNNPSISNWFTGLVTTLSQTFADSIFNHPLNWDTSSNTTLFRTFFRSAFNDPSVGNWVTSAVTTFAEVFRLNNVFDHPLSWDTSSGVSFFGMFKQTIYNQPTPFDTSSAETLSEMFQGAISFNQNITALVLSNVEDMTRMLSGAAALNQDISVWDLRPEGVSLTEMLNGSGISEANYSRLITRWANQAEELSGPFTVSLGASGMTYNTTVYQPGSRFTNAATARAYLVAARGASVASAGNASADGTYAYDAGAETYTNGNSWYFLKSGSTWTLFDDTNASQATGDGDNPWDVTTWTGALSAATVLSSGAGWTITGDAAA